MSTACWRNVASLLSVVTLACDGGAERALAPEVVAAPSAAGADVDRFSTVAFTLIFDPERRLLAAHMPAGVFVCSGGTEPLNVVDVLRVITPSTIGQRLAKQSAEERIAVYHADSPADAGLAAPINFFGFGNIVDGAKFCEFLQGPTRIAEGTVHRVSTFTLASFHGRWTGTIQGVDGRDYHVTETYQLNADIHDHNNPDTFTEPVIRIMLRPVR